MKAAAFLFVWLAPLATAQFYIISTVAGIGRMPFTGAGGSATSAILVQPKGIAIDSSGNTYVSDAYYNQVFQISATGSIIVYAGNGQPAYSGDGGKAIAASLYNPQDLAVDAAGNLYICDYSNSRVRKVTPTGIISTVASLSSPYGVAVDSSGNLYVTQPVMNLVRKVSPSGTVTTIAGTGNPGSGGDGASAINATLYNPEGIRIDTAGNIYFADTYNHKIRKISPQGTIMTIAGNGTGGYAGDGLQATAASLFYPGDIGFDAAGNMYIADSTNQRIRAVDPQGFISTFAGGGTNVSASAALQAQMAIPTAVAVDSQGNVTFPLEYDRLVRRASAQQVITTIAGTLPVPGFGDNVPANTAALLNPVGIASDNAGNLYIGDQIDNRVRKVPTNRIITTEAGTGLYGNTGDNGQAAAAEIAEPRGTGLDPSGNLYVISLLNSVIRKIVPSGTISTFAGSSVGNGGDGGQAAAAQLNIPVSVLGDNQGNVYISDYASARIRIVNSLGIINPFAGTGVPGYSTDSGPARTVQLDRPQQLAIDAQGNIYVADSGNNRIRKIANNGTLTTVAGNGGSMVGGDGGLATAAQIPSPSGVAVDAAGNLYIATIARVRKVDAATGIISTIAGTGFGGFSGDGGLATNATLNNALFLAADGAGNIYVVDQDNQRIRQLTPAQIVGEGVVNGATQVAGPVAPGEIVTIYGGPGITLGPAAGAGLQVNASGLVSTQIGGIQALFDGVPAPLTYVNSSQINAVVPYEVAGESTTQLQVMIQGKPTNTVALAVAASSPGVFVITNQDGSVNSASNPSPSNGELVLYATGEGQTNPAVPTGTVNATVFPQPLLPVTAQIGGQNATVVYGGAAPGFVAGVLQVNVQVPAGVHGTVPLQLRIGTAVTPTGLSISVK